MSGFVVAFFTSTRDFKPSIWLADHEGASCVVSERQFAKVFDDKEAAWNAACAYGSKPIAGITNWIVQPK